MARPPHAPAEAFFLQTGNGARYCMYHAPVGPCRGALVYVHPFAEEMNKSRRMAALQARRLAAQGVAVLLLDLYGCGDSSGDFGDARWEYWRQDLAHACAWLRERTGRDPGLWGLRLGALLALDYASTVPVERLLLWQPVTSGAAFLTQFLRLRLAGDLVAGGDSGGTAALRDSLRAGSALEIAGYELAPGMADALEAVEASALAIRACPVHWFEVTAAAGRPLPPAAARITAGWSAAGVDLRVHLAPGPQFWNTPEITECPALLDATCAVYDEAVHAA